MGAKTSIEWTKSDDGTPGASWNPIRARQVINGETVEKGWHCEIVSPGCEHCYATAINRRLGTGFPYLRHQRQFVETYLDEEILEQTLRWRRPRRIFVCSMSDLFGEWVTDAMLRRVCAAMETAPQHTYQILTKRHERLRDFMQWWVKDRLDNQPPTNWWLGVSVEDQRRADERIPVLLDTPAAVRWISAEPLLDKVIFEKKWLPRIGHRLNPSPMHWCVIGGESGPGARPFNIEWARAIIAQCKAAGVPVFMKQLGAKPYEMKPGFSEFMAVHVEISDEINLRDPKGGDPLEWPEDLRIREYPK